MSLQDKNIESQPERDRLVDRMRLQWRGGASYSKIDYVHITWGPRTSDLTAKQRFALINSVLDQGEAAKSVKH